MTTGDNMASAAATAKAAAPASGSLTAAATSAFDAELQKERGERVEDLWRRLDPQGDKELDFKGLKKGLKKIDHPMKNADEMLRDIIRRVDSNGDGKIQFEEFRVFVEAAERQLLLLFRSIDRDHDGRLNRNELRAAFQKAGLAVPARRLNGFFDEIDSNRDGFISFDEWRDFLLFVPVKGSYEYSTLEAAFSYYASIVILNAEGDSMVSDETLEGLGTTGFLFQALFGSILKLAKPESTAAPGVEQPRQHHRSRIRQPSPDSTSERIPSVSGSPPAPSPPPPPLPPDATPEKEGLMPGAGTASGGRGGGHGAGAPREAARSVAEGGVAAGTTSIGSGAGGLSYGDEDEVYEDLDTDEFAEPTPSANTAPSGTKLQKTQKAAGGAKESKYQLTQYVPHPGYFLAGALAGGISRTATAPFDRLKVYLLVNTRGVVPSGGSGGAAAATVASAGSKGTTGAASAASSTKTAAAKLGRLPVVPRVSGGTIPEAVASLYKAGGFRTFFAGNGLNVVKIMPETAIKFGSYEAAKRGCAAVEGHNDPMRIKPSSKFVAGGLAGMVAQFFVYPLDTLKFRLQCETVQGGATGNALLVQTAKRMWASGGVRAAYRGVTMGLIGMFPYSAIDMGTFELLKATFTRYKAQYYGLHEEDAAPGNVVTGVIGATSGAFGASVVYPLNVLRTRLQTQGTAMHPPTYTGIWDVAHRTLANEGVRGLYKGLTPNLLKVAPALSITWVVYERSKKLMGLP